jgi:hypothetical protein
MGGRQVLDQTRRVQCDPCASESLISDIENTIECERVSSPIAIVMDAGHISLPMTCDGVAWARDNIAYADTLACRLVRVFGRRARLLNVLLINDISEQMTDLFRNTYPRSAYSRNKILKSSSIKLISEKNLVNRAYRYLRSGMLDIKNSGACQLNRAGDSIANGSRQTPIPLAKKCGDLLIPRCSLINFMLLKHTHKLARERLFAHEIVPIIYICFASTEAEYEQVRNGVEAYAMTGLDYPFYSFVVYFENRKSLLYSSFRVHERKWSDEDEKDL